MVTDPIFYRLFETSPETFFLVLGMTSRDYLPSTCAALPYRVELVEIFRRSRDRFRESGFATRSGETAAA